MTGTRSSSNLRSPSSTPISPVRFSSGRWRRGVVPNHVLRGLMHIYIHYFKILSSNLYLRFLFSVWYRFCSYLNLTPLRSVLISSYSSLGWLHYPKDVSPIWCKWCLCHLFFVRFPLLALVFRPSQLRHTTPNSRANMSGCHPTLRFDRNFNLVNSLRDDKFVSWWITFLFIKLLCRFQLEGQISEGYISQHLHSLITTLFYGLSQSSFTRAFNFLPQNSAVRDEQARPVSTLSTHSNSASYSKKSIVVFFFLLSIFVARLCEQ